ncbi:ABC transporter ATP-binding protein/permease [Spirulina subsalsa FACHB-351]|uniref:ABC transporter ATP-binding protein/permease n=1 Tax=Spirulina subsalsa FACHB-351 TaxID=234711 RepID=A0ABT3L0J9_9CYAN|nr:ABC transporter ATP-binding protein [Spirulina subsalsa]MCW6035029.1 ABC transporter ATP-binding protein/permease [Spirulina subsalsa FACHB-351]
MTPNRLLLQFALQYPLLMVLTVVLGFSGAIFNGISTALIVPLLLGFLGQETGLLQRGPAPLQQLMLFFERFPGDFKFIAMIGTVFLAILLKNTAIYLTTIVGSYLNRSLIINMRLQGIQLLLEIDLDFFSKTKLGDIVNCINQEVGRAISSIKIAIEILTVAITILVFTAILVSLSWQLTLISTVLLGLVALSNQYLIMSAKKYGKILSDKSGQYTGKLIEILSGIRLIKTVSTEEAEYKIIKQFIREREEAELKSNATFAAISPLNECLGIMTILAIVVLGRYIFAEQLESLSTILLIYLVTLFRLIPVVGQLNNNRSRFANAAPSAEIVAQFLSRKNKPIMSNGQQPYHRIQEGIRFENVSFAYPGSQDKVLDDINLWVPKGKTVALVGSSGAGKSTLVDLVPRYYDPIEGRITLDGIDLKDFNMYDLRRAMGVVSQDTFLFNNTIAYNISYGKEDATPEEIIMAAKRANAYDFIMELSNGFDTDIGDRGVMLSGGQRQRIAIARALLRDPDILILDEATSALDTVSERLVQEAIDELCRDRTTLVIAHRLSTVQQAYKIAVMEKGRIIEFGDHEELLALNGQYANLHAMQFGKKKSKKVVLPTNAALIRASIRASHELRTRLSYEVRTSLNAMLGTLQLATDDLVDTPEEKQELIEESYAAALGLLKTLSYFEEHGAKSID